MCAAERSIEPAGTGWSTRLHVVTGKGGTGKTSVAAALALALAAGGRRTLLVEVEGRQGIAQLFGIDPLPYEERHLADAPNGGEVRALAVDAEEALLEYLDMFYKLGAAGRALRKLGAIDFATTIAPGLRDVLLTGKVKEATTRTSGQRRVRRGGAGRPTDRADRSVPQRDGGDGPAGQGRPDQDPERWGRRAVALSDDRGARGHAAGGDAGTGDGGRDRRPDLARLRHRKGDRQRHPPPLPAGRAVTAAELKRGLVAAGLPADRDTVAGLHNEARDQLIRRKLEDSLRADLVELGLPMIELPLLPDGVDQAGLATLTQALVRAD